MLLLLCVDDSAFYTKLLQAPRHRVNILFKMGVYEYIKIEKKFYCQFQCNVHTYNQIIDV